MLLFQSEEHVDRWCEMWHQPRGAVLSLGQGWDLAKAWYGPDRRQPDWRRPTLDEAHALYARLGLTGPFWRLN